jgi:hypothetical protein
MAFVTAVAAMHRASDRTLRGSLRRRRWRWRAAAAAFALFFCGVQLGSFLFDEGTEWATSRELHGLAALTFNDYECAVVYAMLT